MPAERRRQEKELVDRRSWMRPSDDLRTDYNSQERREREIQLEWRFVERA